jgi:ribose 5-phosphate isomerase RpiB
LGTTLSLVDVFLETDFEGDRHLRRIAMFNQSGA